MIKLKTLELFGGIGAPRSALENLKSLLKKYGFVKIKKNTFDIFDFIDNE